jgi:hypothetical protein
MERCDKLIEMRFINLGEAGILGQFMFRGSPNRTLPTLKIKPLATKKKNQCIKTHFQNCPNYI